MKINEVFHRDNELIEFFLKKALKESFDVELENNDKVTIEHNYCESSIVDIIIVDCNTKEKHIFYAYDMERHSFP